MSVKLLMYWDIKSEIDNEYFEFVIQEWVPMTAKLGLETVGAWYTVYSRESGTPQIMAEALADDEEAMKEILVSVEWLELHNRLLEYVDNYSQKVVQSTGGFQI
ncbi:hypothetical protein MASR2M15_05330 [Anaerolineales bacterium]